jgi:NAD(P)-dependent dehydrogenase (short-subunit alcohol dehydrogenase family)
VELSDKSNSFPRVTEPVKVKKKTTERIIATPNKIKCTAERVSCVGLTSSRTKMASQAVFFLLDLLAHGVVTLLVTISNVIAFISSLIYDHFFAKKCVMDYQQFAIVITGCDSGFGEMSSRRFSEMGFHVISGCMTEDGVKRLSNVVSVAILCDVTKESDVNQLAQQTDLYLKKKNLKLWAIVNNAGIGNSGAFDWIPTQTIRKVMEVNFFGVVHVTKAFLPLLKQTKNSRIINLSSVAGFHSAPMMGAYAASKHAVEGLMKSVRAELKPWNIQVVNINPGFFRLLFVSLCLCLS